MAGIFFGASFNKMPVPRIQLLEVFLADDNGGRIHALCVFFFGQSAFFDG